MKKSIKLLLLFTMLTGILFFAFSPGRLTPAWIVNHDKLSHFSVFFMVSFMVNFSFPKMTISMQLALLFLFSLLIEIMQLTFFNRGFSLIDIGYNTLGMALFYLFLCIYYQLELNEYIQFKKKI